MNLMPEESSTLATTQKGVVTRSKKSRKKAESITVELPANTSTGQLSPNDTFDLILNALTKDADDRTALEQQTIANQDSFVIQLIERMIEENERLDVNHDQIINDLEEKQRDMIDRAKKLFLRSYQSQQTMIDSLNRLSPQATQLLASAFGSSDPND